MEDKVTHLYTLKKLHTMILISRALTDLEKLEDLIAVVRLISVSKFDYSALLKLVAKNRSVKSFSPIGALLGSQIAFFFGTGLHGARYPTEDALLAETFLDTPARSQIEEEISFLVKLELLTKDTVFKTEKNEKGESVSSVDYYALAFTQEGKRVADAILKDRIPLVRPPKVEQTAVFVASAFNRDDVDMLFEKEIAPTCREFGFAPFRVDTSEPFQTITNSIMLGIQSSPCVIADLTYARPSVYFEIGFAHGLGIPLILTCRQDHYRSQSQDESHKVHFDLEQYKISFWSIMENGDFFWPKRMHPAERLRVIFEKPPTERVAPKS